jgi:hypothetical protein
VSTVPDKRTHRGAHPQDGELFASNRHAALRDATADLSWLLSRGSASPSAVKIVGDRYALDARQRTAVMRCACTDAARVSRLTRIVPAENLRGQTVHLDGYNVLTTVEVALGGGVILLARDSTFRDIASMHGSYRKVEETVPALELIGRTLVDFGVARAIWYLDQPVSNSGQLATIIRELAEKRGWPWEVQIVANPDAVLIESPELIATADSVILDGCARWTNLAREAVTRQGPDAWLVDLSDDPRSCAPATSSRSRPSC